MPYVHIRDLKLYVSIRLSPGELARFSLIFVKRESNGKNLKTSHRHIDTDLCYDQVKVKPCFGEAVNLFS